MELLLLTNISFFFASLEKKNLHFIQIILQILKKFLFSQSCVQCISVLNNAEEVHKNTCLAYDSKWNLVVTFQF